MSEGNNNSSNQAVLLDIDMSNAWGLNMVNAVYSQEAKNINDMLNTLMNTLSSCTKFGADALYGVANSILIGSVCEAAMQFGAGGGAVYASRRMNAIQKEKEPELTKLNDEEKRINEELKDTTISKEKISENNARKEQIKTEKEKIQNKINSANQKAPLEMQAYQAIAQGAGSIPKGYYDSLQQKGQADKGCYDAVERQASSGYDTARSILKGFLDPNYFAGLVTIANIQLR